MPWTKTRTSLNDFRDASKIPDCEDVDVLRSPAPNLIKVIELFQVLKLWISIIKFTTTSNLKIIW